MNSLSTVLLNIFCYLGSVIEKLTFAIIITVSRRFELIRLWTLCSIVFIWVVHTYNYYMACVCSRYNARSDWQIVGHYSPVMTN